MYILQKLTIDKYIEKLLTDLHKYRSTSRYTAADLEARTEKISKITRFFCTRSATLKYRRFSPETIYTRHKP